MRFKSTLAGVVMALALAACAGMSSTPAKFTDGVMTNSAGMTLCAFDKDTAGSGKSVCNGPCAKNWPPLMAAADDKPGDGWSIVTRDDGGKQWAYRGKPLYLWSKDQKPGDRTGDGFINAWHIIKQEPARTMGY